MGLPIRNHGVLDYDDRRKARIHLVWSIFNYCLLLTLLHEQYQSIGCQVVSSRRETECEFFSFRRTINQVYWQQKNQSRSEANSHPSRTVTCLVESLHTSLLCPVSLALSLRSVEAQCLTTTRSIRIKYRLFCQCCHACAMSWLVTFVVPRSYVLGDAIVPECYTSRRYHNDSKQKMRVHDMKRDSLPDAPGVHLKRT